MPKGLILKISSRSDLIIQGYVSAPLHPTIVSSAHHVYSGVVPIYLYIIVRSTDLLNFDVQVESENPDLKKHMKICSNITPDTILVYSLHIMFLL